MNGWFFRSLEGRQSEHICSLPELRGRASEIRAAHRAVKEKRFNAESLRHTQRALEACCERLEAILAQTGAALEQLGGTRDAAGDYFRLMQATYQAFRLPEAPEWVDTILLVMLFWLLEGGMAGAILISEGRMDVPAGLAYGLIFALVNIILGLLIGYLPLRYLVYRSPADLSASDADGGGDRSALLIRRLSAFGLGAGLATEAVLIFGASRLRALGTHEGVFDFSETGFWATFDDSLAIIIAVIGVCSVILAVLKGYRGLDDPIPGFLEAYRQATDNVNEAAEDIAAQAEDAIEDDCERTTRDAEDALADARDALEESESAYAEIACSIDRFNDDVRTAQDADREQRRKDRNLAAFVTGQEQGAPTRPDPDRYDALILPGLDDESARVRSAHTEMIAPVEAALAELEAGRIRCLAEIRAALAAFRSNAPNLDALFDEGEDDA